MRRSSRIHRGLTGARELVGAPYLADPGLRREYEAEIAPRTRAAFGKILGELYAGDAAAPARALDLGAGTGAAGAALRARFGAGLDLVSVDRVAAPGIVVADLTRDLPPTTGRFDLIVAAHLLNELYLSEAPGARIEARARRVLAWCRALLAPGGTFVLLEPALRETSRALLALRDRLIGTGLSVVAPCFWTGPCPALARERDWCHDAAPVPSKPRVDFSYLVLRTEPVAPSPTLYRVVSDPMPEKGRLRLFVCGPQGRHPLIRLTRYRARENAPLDRVTRGAALSIANTEQATDGVRVTPDTIVTTPAPPERA